MEANQTSPLGTMQVLLVTTFFSKTTALPAWPCLFRSPLGLRAVVLLPAIPTPAGILMLCPSTASRSDAHSLLMSLVGALGPVLAGLINEAIFMPSPAPACLFTSDCSVLMRAILAHPHSKHCLEFYHQPQQSDRQERMEGEGSREAATVSCTILN